MPPKSWTSIQPPGLRWLQFRHVLALGDTSDSSFSREDSPKALPAHDGGMLDCRKDLANMDKIPVVPVGPFVFDIVDNKSDITR